MQPNQFIDISQPIRVSGLPVRLPAGTYRFKLDHANTKVISVDPNDSRIKYVSTPLIPAQNESFVNNLRSGNESFVNDLRLWKGSGLN